jgi:hypothetical protein
MKKIIILITGIALCISAGAQTFHKYYSESGAIGNLYRCIQTSDGGYAAAGMIINTLTFDSDMLIVKTDASGNTVWSNIITYSGSDYFNDLVEASNGDIVAVGASMSSTTFVNQAVVVRFGTTGSVIWKFGYDVAGGSSAAKSVQKDGAGNFYVFGNTDVSTSVDYFLMQISSAGAIVNQQIYVTAATDVALAFVRTSYGALYFSGWYNDGSGDNIHLFKVDSALALQWNVRVSGAAGYFCYDIKEKLNNNIVLAGRFDDGASSYDMLLAEFNPVGTPVWGKSYSGDAGLRCHAYGLTINPAGAFAVAAIVEDSIRGTLVAATDINGNVSWSKRIGAATGEYASGYGIATATDGGYIVSGPRSSISGNSSAQLIKTTSTGTFACNDVAYTLIPTNLTLPASNEAVGTGPGSLTSQSILFSASAISTTGDACVVGIDENYFDDMFNIFPNPSANEFRIQNSEFRIKAVEVFNVIGEKIFSEEIAGIRPLIYISASEWNKGIYFVRISVGQKQLSRKVVVR